MRHHGLSLSSGTFSLTSGVGFDGSFSRTSWCALQNPIECTHPAIPIPSHLTSGWRREVPGPFGDPIGPTDQSFLVFTRSCTPSRNQSSRTSWWLWTTLQTASFQRQPRIPASPLLPSSCFSSLFLMRRRPVRPCSSCTVVSSLHDSTELVFTSTPNTHRLVTRCQTGPTRFVNYVCGVHPAERSQLQYAEDSLASESPTTPHPRPTTDQAIRPNPQQEPEDSSICQAD